MKFMILLFGTFSVCVASASTDKTDDSISALKAAIEHGSKCDDRLVSQKLGDRKVEAEVLFRMAARSCGNSASTAMKNASPNELAQASDKIYRDINDAKLGNDKSAWTETDAEIIGGEYSAGEAFANSACSGGNKSACAMSEKFKALEGRIVSKLTAMQKKDSGDSNTAEICPTYFDMTYAQKRMEKEKEKEVGKLSGAIDLEKMHELGSEIINLKNQTLQFSKSFKKKNGRDYDFKSCPQKYNKWSGVDE